MNLVTLPMTVVSGVFFSASHFPGWAQPVIRALPLTALIDGLRAISIDGAGVAACSGRQSFWCFGEWGASPSPCASSAGREAVAAAGVGLAL
jgi:ABC-type polysaccharide/polyol phosphate export permease